MLEPYSCQRDVAYIVVAPENDLVLNNVKMFFKEFSAVYEVWMSEKLMILIFCILFGQHECFSNIVLTNKIKILFISSLSASVGVG